MAPRGGAARTVLGVLWLAALLLFLGYLAAMLVALLLISPGIIEGITVGACSSCTAVFFWINPLSANLLEVVEVGGAGFLVWFFVVLGVIFGIYLYLFFWHGRRTYRDMRLPPERVAEKLASRSPLVTTGQVFMAVLFFDIVYLALILPFGFGIEPEAPPFFEHFPPWYVLYSVVNAAVWEETATRLLLIGLPMAVGSLVTRLAGGISFPRAKSAGRARHLAGSFKYLLGGQVHEGSSRSAKLVGAALVLISAAIFGYLHVPAWGAWKFVDTFIAGLALGYLFLRHGILASILLHLSVNTLGVLFTVTGAETNLGAALLLGVFYLALVAFGGAFLLYYAIRTGRFLLRPLRGSGNRPTSPPPRRPRAVASQADVLLFPVRCPRCGGREAQYAEGALLCSRCGTSLSAPPPAHGGGQLLD